MRGWGLYDVTGQGILLDLGAILRALGRDAYAAQWRATSRIAYIADEAVPVLEDYASAETWVSGRELARISAQVHQVIDGRLEARQSHAAGGPWLVLRAIDSSWWEVYSDDPKVELALRRAFRDVRPARYADSDEIPA